MNTDTTSKAEARQLDIYRRMSGEERLRISMSLSDQMRDIALAGLKRRHPQAGEEELRTLYYMEIHNVVIKEGKGETHHGKSGRFFEEVAEKTL